MPGRSAMEISVRLLPARVDALLRKYAAPARLEAHLSIVHEVACVLTERVCAIWPILPIDTDAVALGAASHDIGKTLYPEELNQPGNDHEEAGRGLLLENGWPEPLARFAVTHGCDDTQRLQIEDLLVALADKVWKGKREDVLEQALAQRIAAASGEELWEVWLRLDDILFEIAATAEERLL